MGQKISYDEKYDTIYVRWNCDEHSYGTEDDNGVVIYRSVETNDVTGIAIQSISDLIRLRGE